MTDFVGNPILSPVEAFDEQTVQLASEFNLRYQSLFDRLVWQKNQNLAISAAMNTSLAEADAQRQRASALGGVSLTPINNAITQSSALSAIISSREGQLNAAITLSVSNRLVAVNSFFQGYQPQPYNPVLQSLGTLQKRPGRLLGYQQGSWKFWAKAANDQFTVSAAHANFERPQGSSSNASFIEGSWNTAPMNRLSSSLAGGGVAGDGINLPASGTTILLGIQPALVGAIQSQVWNASVGGDMNTGSSAVGYVGSWSRSELWNVDSICFGVGSYTSDSNFSYQLRSRISGLPTSPGWASGTFMGFGGVEVYSSMLGIRIS